MTTDPPPKDPQPETGLYSNCFPGLQCSNLQGTGGCFQLIDGNTEEPFDGFCTILCQSEANCVPKPNSPAVTKCLVYGDPDTPTNKACFLQCSTDSDCPNGMTCESVGPPLNDNFCW